MVQRLKLPPTAVKKTDKKDNVRHEQTEPCESNYKTDELTAGSGYLVPSGCSLLNAALTNNVYGGYQTGRIANPIGDTHTGKSITALTGMAETAHDSAWDDYSLVYRDFEYAMSFNISRLFGKKTYDRMIQANLEDGYRKIEDYVPPQNLQEWYKRILKRIKSGKPFIEIVDSWDSVVPIEEYERADAIVKDKKEKGSFKNEKSRLASEYLRILSGLLTKTDSLLILVSQTRDNLDPMSFSNKKRSGGKALDFYSSYIYWLTKIKSFYSGPVKGGDGDDDGEKKGGPKARIGRLVGFEVTKTKTTGFEGKIEIPMYRQIGIDNTQASLDFVLKNLDSGICYKEGNFIVFNDIKAYKMEICRQIDENPELTHILNEQLQEAWNEFIRTTQINRKPRFAE